MFRDARFYQEIRHCNVAAVTRIINERKKDHIQQRSYCGCDRDQLCRILKAKDGRTF